MIPYNDIDTSLFDTYMVSSKHNIMLLKYFISQSRKHSIIEPKDIIGRQESAKDNDTMKGENDGTA